MNPLRTAMIGCGSFAHTHASRLARLEDVQLVGFCDRLVENASGYNQRYADGQAQVYEEYERMYEALDLDLVYICLPPFAHDREVELACRYGVHFLIEKRRQAGALSRPDTFVTRCTVGGGGTAARVAVSW